MEMFEILLQLGLACLLIYGVYYWNNYDKKKLERQVKNEKHKLETLGFKGNNIKMSLYGDLNGQHAFITNEDELYVVTYSGVKQKIDFSEVLSVTMDMHVNERNTRRIIAFTSTYDKRVEVIAVDLKINTFKDTYIVRYTRGSLTPIGMPYGDKINEVERFKLGLEKLIKESKAY